jgi:hypothetical protein
MWWLIGGMPCICDRCDIGLWLFVMRLVILYSSDKACNSAHLVYGKVSSAICSELHSNFHIFHFCLPSCMQVHFIYDVGLNCVYISLEAFAAAELDKILSGRQPHQCVWASCIWCAEDEYCTGGLYLQAVGKAQTSLWSRTALWLHDKWSLGLTVLTGD